MVVLNFIVAIVALIIAIIAFQKTGGIMDLRKNSAELLAKMEKKMR
jgi:mannitol-specific phosphotransferase system IIBC component